MGRRCLDLNFAEIRDGSRYRDRIFAISKNSVRHLRVAFFGRSWDAVGAARRSSGVITMRAFTDTSGYQIAIGTSTNIRRLTHGMFLFELIAGMFFLFGDSDFTLRLGMVLFGSALILVPLLLRRQLGDNGALLTSVMLTFSPALFYFSRFARNDILMALFIALLVVAMWRYIEERRYRWFYIAAGLIAISMATKESAYIFVVIFAAYFAWVTRYEIRDILLGNMRLSEISPAGHILVLLVALSAPFFARWDCHIPRPDRSDAGGCGRDAKRSNWSARR